MEDGPLNKAFEVKGLPDNFDPSKPPVTGHEYLQHVMYEASNCPQVVVADVDRAMFRRDPMKRFTFESDCLQYHALAPTSEWQECQVALFSELRRKVNKFRTHKDFQPMTLPDPRDEEKWYGIFFGDATTKMRPDLTVLLSMSELTLAQLLEYHAEWMEGGLKPDQAVWLYSIMASLSLPLSSDVCSSLRQLARNCAKLRSLKTVGDREVTSLNLIICIVSKYFGQLDLAD